MNILFLVGVMKKSSRNFEPKPFDKLRENCFRVLTGVKPARQKAAFESDSFARFEVNKVNGKCTVHSLPLQMKLGNQAN